MFRVAGLRGQTGGLGPVWQLAANPPPEQDQHGSRHDGAPYPGNPRIVKSARAYAETGVKSAAAHMNAPMRFRPSSKRIGEMLP